jgi:hypothetical protein
MTVPHWAHVSGAEFIDEACYPVEAVPALQAPVQEDRVKAQGKAPRSWPRSEWEWEILNCPDVGRVEKSVGWVLSRRCDYENGRNAYPSQAWIAGVLGYTRTKPVSDALNELQKLGWIYRDGYGPAGPSGFRPHQYRLTVPDCDHVHEEDTLPRILK